MKTISRMGFLKDKEFGDGYHGVLAQLIEHTSFKNAPDRKFYDWDMEFENDGETFTMEIKADKKHKDTGNICIEYACNGKPSGISKSLADFWCIFSHNPMGESVKWFCIPTQTIRDMIEQKKYSRKTRGGDRWAAELYLFNDGVFNEFADVFHKDVMPEQLRGALNA
jgi:hypothetical protein